MTPAGHDQPAAPLGSSAAGQRVRVGRRWFLAVVCGALLLGVSLALLPGARARGVGSVRAVLRGLPGQWDACGSSIGRLVAVERGGAVDPACFRDVTASPVDRDVLRAQVLDARLGARARASAAGALLVIDPPRGARLMEGLFAAPAAPPRLRRQLLRSVWEGPMGVALAERHVAAAPHGLRDVAVVSLAAYGAPELGHDAAEAVLAGGDPSPALRIWGAPLPSALRGLCATESGAACRRAVADLLAADARSAGFAPAAPLEEDTTVPTMPAARAAFGADARAHAHFLDDARAVLDWVGGVSAPRRSARLRAALLHAGAERVRRDEHPLHAALRDATARPGTVALLLEAFAARTGVDVQLRVTKDGLAARVGSRWSSVDACGRVSTDAPAGGVDVPVGGGGALGLVEAVGDLLDAGDLAGARDAVLFAASAWPEAPGLATARATVLAARGTRVEEAVAPALRDPGPPRRGSERGRRALQSYLEREAERSAAVRANALWEALAVEPARGPALGALPVTVAADWVVGAGRVPWDPSAPLPALHGTPRDRRPGRRSSALLGARASEGGGPEGSAVTPAPVDDVAGWVLGAAPDPAGRLVAAYHAARHGHAALARVVMPEWAPGLDASLWGAVRAWLDGRADGGTMPAWSSEQDGGRCPAAFTPLPS